MTEPARPRVVGIAAACETLLIVLGLLASVFLGRHEGRYDGWVRSDALTQLLTTGKLPTIPYSMVGPIFATPLWYLGKMVKDSQWWVDRYNAVVLGAGLLAIYLLLRRRVDPGLLRRFFLLLVAASMFGNHLSFFYGEVFTATLLAVGVAAIVVGKRLAGWATLIIGVVNTPATLAGLTTMMAAQVIRTRALRYGLAAVVAAALILVVNWIQRGDPFTTGYEGVHAPETIMPYSGREGFSNPLFFGLLGLLFSFGKGLLYFAPGLFLPVRRALTALADGTSEALYRWWMAFLVGLVLVYAMWLDWYGGWFWGPRFVLFASVPASFVLAVRLTRARDASPLLNVFTALALCLSVWVGVSGAVYGDGALWDPCVGNYVYETPLCYYTPEFSVLWYPFVRPAPLSGELIIYMVYILVVGAYLLVPLLATIGRQLTKVAREAGWLTWRYRW